MLNQNQNQTQRSATPSFADLLGMTVNAVANGVGSFCLQKGQQQQLNSSALESKGLVVVENGTGSGTTTTLLNCPSCQLADGELQVMRAEMALLRQFLNTKLTMMEQKMDSVHAMMKQWPGWF